ncbi:MAG: hypothetical protein ABSB35_16115 [Bryobacteraceae bacterium]|jgi:hypothetical protein
MSRPAKLVWDELVREMAPANVLHSVDQRALWQLTEDEALLSEAYSGLWKMTKALENKAQNEGKELPRLVRKLDLLEFALLRHRSILRLAIIS